MKLSLSILFLLNSIIASTVFANRVFECDFTGSLGIDTVRKVTFSSVSPDKFPHNYQSIQILDEANIQHNYVLELVEGNAKSAVWRFLLGQDSFHPPMARYGILAWSPGAGKLYLDIESGGVKTEPLPPSGFYAGPDICRQKQN